MKPDLEKLKIIQIFRAGIHRSMTGQSTNHTAADLDKMAAAYNDFAERGEHIAPLCIGHPLSDRPAYGSVHGLISRGGALFAAVDPSPSLVHWVRSGMYKAVSASFHQYNSSLNPSGRAWFLKHVGFLDGVNMRPAVKGMASPAFSEGEALPVTFRGSQEHVFFSEFNAAAPREDATRHKFITEVQHACSVSYSEAVNLAKPYLWR